MTEQRMYEDEIDLGALILMLWRNLWKLLIAAVAAAVIVYAVTPKTIEESFTAGVDLYVGYEDEYAENKPDLKTTVQSCMTLIKTSSVIGQVRDTLNLQQSLDDIEKLITLNVVNDSSILHLEVTSNDGEQAGKIAAALAEAAETEVSETTGYAFCRRVGDVEIKSSVSSRNVMKYSVAAAVLVAVIGAIILLCKELFDRSIKDSDGAAAVTGLPVLGVVPELKSDRRQKKDHPRTADKAELPFAYVESYKSLRTGIMFKAEEAGAKTILLTSSVANEDVYNTAVNLAAALAEAGRKTIIADCDLRTAALTDYMEMPKRQGMSDILSGRSIVQDCVCDTAVANLKAIQAGGTVNNSSELLAGSALKPMLQVLKESYDYVIIIAPPALAVTDAAVLATAVDGVLVVTRTRFVKPETVRLAIDKLREVKGNVLGIVLTRLDVAKLYNKSGYAQVFKER